MKISLSKYEYTAMIAMIGGGYHTLVYGKDCGQDFMLKLHDAFEYVKMQELYEGELPKKGEHGIFYVRDFFSFSEKNRLKLINYMESPDYDVQIVLGGEEYPYGGIFKCSCDEYMRHWKKIIPMNPYLGMYVKVDKDDERIEYDTEDMNAIALSCIDFKNKCLDRDLKPENLGVTLDTKTKQGSFYLKCRRLSRTLGRLYKKDGESLVDALDYIHPFSSL